MIYLILPVARTTSYKNVNNYSISTRNLSPSSLEFSFDSSRKRNALSISSHFVFHLPQIRIESLQISRDSSEQEKLVLRCRKDVQILLRSFFEQIHHFLIVSKFEVNANNCHVSSVVTKREALHKIEDFQGQWVIRFRF